MRVVHMYITKVRYVVLVYARPSTSTTMFQEEARLKVTTDYAT